MRKAIATLVLIGLFVTLAVAYLIGYAVGTRTWEPAIAAIVILASVAVTYAMIASDRKD